MSDLTYCCPLCHENLRVAPSLVGDQIDCPHCHHAIRVEAPIAELVDDSVLTGDKPLRVASPLDSEEVIRVVHPVMFRAHPVWFALLLLCVIAGGVLAFGGSYFSFPWQLAVGWIAGGVLAVIGLVGFFAWWVTTQALTLEITSKRTRSIRGLVAKSTSEVQHDDVRNIQVVQSFYGRLVDVGRLAVSSSGQDGLEIVADGIPGPNHIAGLIRDRQ